MRPIKIFNNEIFTADPISNAIATHFKTIVSSLIYQIKFTLKNFQND